MKKLERLKSALYIGIILLTFYGCSSPLSFFDQEIYVKEVVKSELSPSGKYQAVVYIDGGGDATVDFSKHVSIVSKDQNISKGVKIKSNQSTFKGYHIRNIDVKWQADNRLLIYHNYNQGIMKQDTSKDGIEIQYVYLEEE